MHPQIIVQPLQWQTLPDMEAMDQDLTAGDAACLNDLRGVLERHVRLDRFGITLLHRHFDLGPDEVLLETIDFHDRTLMVRPVPKAELGNAVQTQWRLSGLDPLQWCESYCQRVSGGHPHGHQRNLLPDA